MRPDTNNMYRAAFILVLLFFCPAMSSAGTLSLKVNLILDENRFMIYRTSEGLPVLSEGQTVVVRARGDQLASAEVITTAESYVILKIIVKNKPIREGDPVYIDSDAVKTGEQSPVMSDKQPTPETVLPAGTKENKTDKGKKPVVDKPVVPTAAGSPRTGSRPLFYCEGGYVCFGTSLTRDFRGEYTNWFLHEGYDR